MFNIHQLVDIDCPWLHDCGRSVPFVEHFGYTFAVTRNGRQKRKAKAEKKYDEFQLERDTELEKMNDTRNILQKALHFRNAAAATEQMDYTGLHYMVDIPSKDDVVEIGNGLQMVKSGTIWSKAGSFDSFRAAKHHILLGSCTVGN